MTTDFEELFDDIMFYAKKKLGGKDFATKEDLEDYIKDSDPQQKIKQWVRKELVDTRRAERAITTPPEKPKDTVAKKAITAELRRKQRARTTDESRTAKTVKPLTTTNYKQWLKNPGRFDLKGIDTKTHTLIHQEINRRLRAAKNKGHKVGMKGADPYRKERGETRRSLITGRYISRK